MKLKTIIFYVLLLLLVPVTIRAVNFDFTVDELKMLLGGSEPQLGATKLFPYQGGTGTSTPPTANQILIGNASGVYDVKDIADYVAAPGAPGAWQTIWTNTLAPTNTSAGIFVYASSTFNSTLRVNGTLSGDGFDTAWDTKHNATSTYPGAEEQFDEYYNATTTLNGLTISNYFETANFETYFDTYYNATTTLNGLTISDYLQTANFETYFDTYYNATTTLNGFTNNSANWDTAYGWGDWSGEGFITAADVPANETDATFTAWAGYTDGRLAVINSTTTLIDTLTVTNAINGSVTGNAGTATALASDPTDCTNQVAYAIAANGNLTCTDVTPTYMDLTVDYAWTGLHTFSDARPAMLNATNTNIDTLRVYGNATSSQTIDAAQFCISGANCLTAWPSGTSPWTDGGDYIYTTNGEGLVMNASSTYLGNLNIKGESRFTNNLFATTSVIDTLTVTNAITGSISGNAGTATALAADPDDCTNQFAHAIAASGNLTCASVAPTYMDLTQAYTFTGILTASSDLRATGGLHASTTDFDALTVGTSVTLPDDSIVDAYLDWGNFTDLAAGGVVTWSNLAEGELATGVVVSDDIKDGTIAFADFGTDIITGADAVGTFESGDTFLCMETGVGVKECDYDNLPGAASGLSDINTQQLGQLSDVSTTTLAVADILMWTGTSWINQATSSIIMDYEIDTYSELNTIVADKTLLIDGGTQTDTQVCVSDGGAGAIDCNIAQTYWVQDGCTDCLNATEIEDIYLLLAGDSSSGAYTWTGLNTWTDARPAMLNATTTNIGTLTVYTGITLPADVIVDSYIDDDGSFAFTGKWDFGGGDLEIPNGATVADPNAAGEVAIDTTSDQFLFYGGAQRVLPYWSEKCFTMASTTWAVNASNFPLWHPAKAIEITDVYCETDGGTSISVTFSDGSNALEAITCDEDGAADDGSITNGTFTANERFEVDLASITGAVNYLNACITYVITAD